MITHFRDWAEQYDWYWFSINLSFNVMPYHWELNYCKYDWGFGGHFGPFGILILWR